MELFVFFLIPSLLLIVFIILLIRNLKSEKKTDLTIIEPIDLLVDKWRLVRSEPESIAELIMSLSHAFDDKESPLDLIISDAAKSIRQKSKIKRLEILGKENFAVLSEIVSVKKHTKNVSYLIGPYHQINGRLAGSEMNSIHEKLNNDALKHGYLSLSIAELHHHSHHKTDREHVLLGTLIIEPISTNLEKLSHIGHLKLMTVLPEQLAKNVFTELTGRKTLRAITSKELSEIQPIKFAEAEIEVVDVIADTDPSTRHLAIRTWQSQHNCRLFSSLKEDEHLPISPLRRLDS